MNINVPTPPNRGGRQANSGVAKLLGCVKGMHGKGTPEPVQETYQTLKMDRDNSRKCHSSLARHDKRHNIHSNLKISNSYSYKSDYSRLQLTLPRTKTEPGVVLHVKTQRKDQWASE